MVLSADKMQAMTISCFFSRFLWILLLVVRIMNCMAIIMIVLIEYIQILQTIHLYLQSWGILLSKADYEISFEFLAYRNRGQRKANGRCCDFWCGNGCDTEMLVCLKRTHHQACIGGAKSSGVIGSADSYIFHGPSNIGRMQNPLVHFGITIPNVSACMKST